jgi:hypothetical protein
MSAQCIIVEQQDRYMGIPCNFRGRDLSIRRSNSPLGLQKNAGASEPED